MTLQGIIHHSSHLLHNSYFSSKIHLISSIIPIISFTFSLILSFLSYLLHHSYITSNIHVMIPLILTIISLLAPFWFLLISPWFLLPRTLFLSYLLRPAIIPLMSSIISLFLSSYHSSIIHLSSPSFLSHLHHSSLISIIPLSLFVSSPSFLSYLLHDSSYFVHDFSHLHHSSIIHVLSPSFLLLTLPSFLSIPLLCPLSFLSYPLHHSSIFIILNFFVLDHFYFLPTTVYTHAWLIERRNNNQNGAK